MPVLPPGTIIDLPYEELIADQEGWTRKTLDFLGLEWDERVLNFHETKRAVATASFWQVRQKIYTNSVEQAAEITRNMSACCRQSEELTLLTLPGSATARRQSSS